MKLIATLLLSAMMLLASTLCAAEQHMFGKYVFETDSTIPAWVNLAKDQKSKGKPEGQNTEYALLDTQVRAFPEDYQFYKAYSSYLHNSQAVSESSEIQITFNPEYQQLVIHTIGIVRGKEKFNVLRPEIVRLLQQEEDLRNGILDGAVTALVMVPNTRPGDRLDYSYTIKGRNPVYGEKIFGVNRLGWAVDVGFTRVRVLVPKQTKLQTNVHGVKTKYKKRKKSDYIEHEWLVKKVDRRVDEGGYPAWFNRYGFIEYSEFKNWTEVSNWADGLYQSVDQSSTELDKLVKKLQDGSATDSEYAVNALDFVQQQVRYLGLEFGLNSHLPHTPAEVLKNRYGDCKDKSNLLVQLLQKNGIEAYSALVSYSYREGFSDYLPSPFAFDHAIVMANVSGKKVWLDPTRTNQSGKLNKRAFLKFGASLVVGRDGEKPVESLKPLPGQTDIVTVKESYKVKNTKKPVILTVKSVYTGGQAEYIRSVFKSSSYSEMQDKYLNYYAKIYPAISAQGKISYNDSEDENEITITEKYKIKDFFEKEEGLYKSSYYATAIGQFLTKPEVIRRESPAIIGQPIVVSHEITVDYLNEVAMYIDSTPVIKTTEEIDYTSRSAFFSKHFEHRATLKIKKNWVPVESMERYLSLAKQIENDIDFSLTFSSEGKKTNNKPLKKLLKVLEK